ncbi:MAG: adenosylcobinamide-GDP ribazoletransferase [Dehalococcoidia bacterium]|nr:adenosylcobinamide-GDP ribazoletransferase [Dehalococcoidia bacterium]
MSSLFAAIGFLTIIPMPRVSEGALARARMWFPVVGLGIGGLLAGFDYALREGFWALTDVGFPSLLLAALILAFLVIITRALHLDGFMDTCDALFGGDSAERRLDIMRDSRVGSFAVAGALCLFLISFAAIVSLWPPGRFWALLLIPCLSRWAMVVTMAAFPYARGEDGLGSAFLTGGTGVQTVVATVLVVAAAVVLAGATGIVLLVVAVVVALGVGQFATSRLGGLTGDIYGAVNELATMAMLVAASLIVLGDVMPLEPVWSGMDINFSFGDDSYAP